MYAIHYNQGQRAFDEYKSADVNPYRANTEEHKAWYRGWLDRFKFVDYMNRCADSAFDT